MYVIASPTSNPAILVNFNVVFVLVINTAAFSSALDGQKLPAFIIYDGTRRMNEISAAFFQLISS